MFLKPSKSCIAFNAQQSTNYCSHMAVIYREALTFIATRNRPAYSAPTFLFGKHPVVISQSNSIPLYVLPITLYCEVFVFVIVIVLFLIQQHLFLVPFFPRLVSGVCHFLLLRRHQCVSCCHYLPHRTWWTKSASVIVMPYFYRAIYCAPVPMFSKVTPRIQILCAYSCMVGHCLEPRSAQSFILEHF